MEIKKGIGVSHGVVISSAIVLDAEDTVIPRRQIDPANAPAEITRLQEGVPPSVLEIAQLRDGISAQHGKEIGGIFDVHLGMLKDPTLLNQIVTEIRARNVSAEHAVSVVMRGYANSFLKLSDRYFSERVKDIYDIERRILRYLIGRQHEDLGRLTQDVVIICHDLLPSQTAALDKKHVRGFATDVGGRTSHTAIVARAMGIPAVVGLGNITSEVSGGDTVIIDGGRGVVIVNPDPDQLAEYQEDAKKLFQL